jgi:hypothetical protein
VEKSRFSHSELSVEKCLVLRAFRELNLSTGDFIMPITGKWYNELGSSMEVALSGNLIRGNYSNAAGQAEGDYDYFGVVEPDPTGTNQAVAWVVTWVRKSDQKNFHSVTSWSGQYQLIHDRETITAEWLLTSETDPTDDWSSTTVGHDVFRREPPAKEFVERRLRLSAWSHPK